MGKSDAPVQQKAGLRGFFSRLREKSPAKAETLKPPRPRRSHSRSVSNLPLSSQFSTSQHSIASAPIFATGQFEEEDDVSLATSSLHSLSPEVGDVVVPQSELQYMRAVDHEARAGPSREQFSSRENEATTSRLDEITASVALLQSQLERSSHPQQVAAHEPEAATLQTEMVELSRTLLSKSEQERARARGDCETMARELGQLRRLLEEKVKLAVDLETENRTLRGERGESSVSSLHRELAEAHDHSSQLAVALEQAAAENTHLKETLSQYSGPTAQQLEPVLTEALNQLESQVRERDATLSNLRQNLSFTESLRIQSEAEAEKSRADLVALRRERCELREKYDACCVDSAGKVPEHLLLDAKHQHETERRVLQHKLDNLAAELDRLKLEKTETDDSLAMIILEKKDLTAAVELLTGQQTSLLKNNDELKLELEQLREKVTGVLEESSATDDIIAAAVKTARSAERQSRRLEKRLVEREHATEELIVQMQADMERIRDKNSRLRQDFTEKLSVCQKKIKANKISHRNQLGEYAAEVARLQKLMLQKDGALADLESWRQIAEQSLRPDPSP